MTQDDLPVCDLAASKSATSLSAFSESDDNIQSTVDSHPMTGRRKSSLTKSLDGLKGHKNKNLRNPFLAYLNINHLRNKIIDLRCILKEISIEYIAISETKLDGSFPDSQFKIDGYHSPPPPPPFRRDRNCHGGGLMVYIKNDIIATRLIEFEPQEIKCICTKITIAKKHWLVFQYIDLQNQETLMIF